MQEGIVKWFNTKKNYGFIESEGETDIFFHSSSIIDHGLRNSPGNCLFISGFAGQAFLE